MDPTKHELIAVQPWPAPEGTTGTWPCAICDGSHPVTDSWRITYRTAYGPQGSTVCRSCALEARTGTRTTTRS